MEKRNVKTCTVAPGYDGHQESGLRAAFTNFYYGVFTIASYFTVYSSKLTLVLAGTLRH